MDRETIVRASNQLIVNRNITQSEINILIEYCVEHGKPLDKTIQFIKVTSSIPNALYSCLLDALSYYRKKFGIIEISKINLNGLNQGKEVIKYY